MQPRFLTEGKSQGKAGKASRSEPAESDYEGQARNWIADNANENTKKRYSTYQKQFLSWLGEHDVQLAEVGPEHVVCWMKHWLSGDWRSTPSTARQRLVADLFRWEERSPTRDELVALAKMVVSKAAA